MPEIGVVQKPGLFEDLLKRLGVNRPTRPFTLDGNILPVVLVESGISFVAAPTPPYQVTDIFTAGEQTAPAAGTVLADTGQLPVGAYSLYTVSSAEETARLELQVRDAPNTGTLVAVRFWTLAGAPSILSTRITISNANERFRIINVAGAAVAQRYIATIMAKI